MSNDSQFAKVPWIKWTFSSAAFITFAFLYLPVAVLVLYSFNDAPEFVFPPRELSLRWYIVLLEDTDMQQSIINSLMIAAAVAPFCLVLGVLASLSLDRFEFYGKSAIERLVLLPMIIPRLITGLAILLVVKFIGIKLSMITMVIGHVVVWLPLVISQVYARLRRLDRQIEEASMDLGANPWRTFWRVTFPNIKTSLIGSGLLVFTLSFDEIAVSFFLTGRDNTLPMHIWAMLRSGVTPEIAAIATINLLVSVSLLLIALRLVDLEFD